MQNFPVVFSFLYLCWTKHAEDKIPPLNNQIEWRPAEVKSEWVPILPFIHSFIDPLIHSSIHSAALFSRELRKYMSSIVGHA